MLVLQIYNFITIFNSSTKLVIYLKTSLLKPFTIVIAFQLERVGCNKTWSSPIFAGSVFFAVRFYFRCKEKYAPQLFPINKVALRKFLALSAFGEMRTRCSYFEIFRQKFPLK
jgi:hypothetical protein